MSRAERAYVAVPVELRDAEELLERYGRWAQDRYRKQRCASAEGGYQAPTLGRDEERPLSAPLPDWNAMQVQRALQVVPMEFRRVLHAYYIPQRLPHHAVRRQLKITSGTWERSRLEGLRQFSNIYRLRYLT